MREGRKEQERRKGGKEGRGKEGRKREGRRGGGKERKKREKILSQNFICEKGGDIQKFLERKAATKANEHRAPRGQNIVQSGEAAAAL
jgi:hypothetical protein